MGTISIRMFHHSLSTLHSRRFFFWKTWKEDHLDEANTRGSTLGLIKTSGVKYHLLPVWLLLVSWSFCLWFQRGLSHQQCQWLVFQPSFSIYLVGLFNFLPAHSRYMRKLAIRDSPEPWTNMNPHRKCSYFPIYIYHLSFREQQPRHTRPVTIWLWCAIRPGIGS